MTGELYRPVSLSKIVTGGLTVIVRASLEECAALAARMDIPAIQFLECRFDLTAGGDGISIHGKGRLCAQVTRVCVVSAEDFEARVEDEFDVCFVPSGQERDDPDPDMPDEIPYYGDTIDLGEAASEQLALALDPYPRIEGATMPDLEDGDDASPFAVLSRRALSDGPKH